MNLLFGKTTNEFIRIFRALFVGGVSMIFDMAALFFVTSVLHLFYQIGVVAGFFVGAVVNYILTHFWVFSRVKISRKKHTQDFILFGIIGVIGLLLTMGLIFILYEQLAFSLFVSKILSAILVFFWNYGARKVLIFEKK